MNDRELITREIIAPVVPEIESALQKEGWNGAIRDQIWRIKPTLYSREVDSENAVSHLLSATLDDLNIRMIIKQQDSGSGVVNTRLSSLNFTKS